MNQPPPPTGSSARSADTDDSRRVARLWALVRASALVTLRWGPHASLLGAGLAIGVLAIWPRLPDDSIRPVPDSVPTWPGVDAECDSSCPALQRVTLSDDLGAAPQEYHMGFVEIDDEGRFRDRAQLERAMETARELGSSGGLILFAYVHGWNHDARVGDSDIQCVGEIARAVSLLQGSMSSRRATMALYVGWRGNEVASPLVNKTSFWGRMDAADRIGARGAMRELVLELADLKSGVDEEVIVVLVGHSLGARITFAALRPFLEVAALTGTPPPASVDVALLVNPAFSAIEFQALAELQERATWPGPSVLIAASESDGVTRGLYPGAFGLTGLRAMLRRQVSPEDSLRVHAIGTHRALWTNELRIDATDVAGRRYEEGCPGMRATDLGFVAGRDRVQDPTDLFDYARIPVLARPTDAASPDVGRDTVTWVTLDPPELDRVAVVGVERALIPDHNGFWGSHFAEFVVRLVNYHAFGPGATGGG